MSKFLKKCNLKCFHCYAGEGTNSGLKEMTKEEIERAVISLGSSIICEPKLLIFSGGEPTLEKDKLKIAIETAVKFGLNLRLNTNGHGIDESLAKYLSEKQLHQASQ